MKKRLIILLGICLTMFLPLTIHAGTMSGLFFGTIDSGAGPVITGGIDKAVSQELDSVRNIRLCDSTNNGYSHSMLVRNKDRILIYISQVCRRVGAERGLYVTISRFHEQYTLTCHVISPHTYKEVYRHSVSYSPASMSERAVEQIFEDVDAYFAGVKQPAKTPPKPGYYARLILPGWAQGYNNYPDRSALYQGMFGVGLVFIGSSYIHREYRHDRYLNFKPSPDFPGDTSHIEKMERYYQEYKAADQLFVASLQFMGYVYLCNFIDGLFFSKNYNTSYLEKQNSHNSLQPSLAPVVFVPQGQDIAYGASLSVFF